MSAVRGVNCDGVLRTLVLRGLIEEQSTDPETGAILYRTTSYFLERLGLASLAELPELAPFLPDLLEEAAESAGAIVASPGGAAGSAGEAAGSGGGAAGPGGEVSGSGDDQGS